MMLQKGIIISILSLFIIGWITYHYADKASADNFVKTGNDNMKDLSTWIWNTDIITNNPQQVISELKAKRVQTVYLQINQSIPMSSYQVFISQLHKLNIRVYALDGSSDWINQENNGKILLIDWLQNYQEQANTNQKFSGIHIDVEPYLNKLWTINQNQAIKQYQDMIYYLKKAASDMHLIYSMDVPFWFNSTFYTNETYGKGLLSNWVTDQSDSITIMDYRNIAKGPNGLIQLVAHQIAYASKHHKSVIIGVETQNLHNSPSTTFFNKGEKDMMTTLREVAKVYKHSSSFNGFAIHSFSSWMAIK